MSRATPVVIAIHPEHAEAILSGRKTFEVRRRFPSLSGGTTVFLYATAPISSVIGGFTFGGAVSGSQSELWSLVGEGAAISRRRFREYLSGVARGTGVRVTGPFRLRRPASLGELSAVGAAPFGVPQSVSYINDELVVQHLERLR